VGKTHFKTKIYPVVAGGGGGYIQYTRTSLVLTKGRGAGRGGGQERAKCVCYKRCLLVVVVVGL